MPGEAAHARIHRGDILRGEYRPSYGERFSPTQQG